MCGYFMVIALVEINDSDNEEQRIKEGSYEKNFYYWRDKV